MEKNTAIEQYNHGWTLKSRVCTFAKILKKYTTKVTVGNLSKIHVSMAKNTQN